MQEIPTPQMLLSSDQEALLRSWFALTAPRRKHRETATLYASRLRFRLADAKVLARLIDDVFKRTLAGASTRGLAELTPYFRPVVAWVRSLVEASNTGTAFATGDLRRLSGAAQKFVLTLGSMDVQSYNAQLRLHVRVPEDVFYLIFAEFQFRIKDRVCVSRVCHYWRRICLATPQLWTTLELHDNIYSRTPYITHSRLSQLVRLSGDGPLTLRVSNVQADTMGALSLCIFAQLHRICVLDITFHSNVQFRSEWLRAIHQPAPALEYLRLTGVQYEDYSDKDDLIPIPSDIFQGHAPRLWTVDLGALNLPESCPAFAEVRSFTGQFVHTRRRRMRQTRQTQLVYQLCPRLEGLALCYIRGTEALPRPPPGIKLKEVIVNSCLPRSRSHESQDVYLAVSGLGNLAPVQTALALGGDVDAVMRLWCDALPPWQSVVVETCFENHPRLATAEPILCVSAECGDFTRGVKFNTREFKFPLSYLTSDDRLGAQLRQRIGAVTVCGIVAFMFRGGVNFLAAASKLEELDIILDGASRLSRNFAPPLVLHLPSLKVIRFRTPSFRMTDFAPQDRTISLPSAEVLRFLKNHLIAPQLECLTFSRDLKVTGVAEALDDMNAFAKDIQFE
ncbi:hypothetical protein AURDEDRAFT_125054 [Auricularia subglabra TFB-10046 SS5]|nr:hypothetical protein AURDEDRAFT_125054 [Auricularia subglabra TFB-10046 SS5]